ncbi:CRISPR-associated endonuclease Cas2 [Oculatella sp. FACHB-28]|uniref:CRISPR-associated endonuclease Cas2 n=1 Tax=Oculatella sp. FACHB-28 TaxID=2692845 RepID=UPI001686CD26|nr:CRISPR-associated endonuclease Cas2 [Oculatella sp. FACHB-28]
MLLYVVAYDISCQKRRTKVSNVLSAYGQRVQYSVFECVLQLQQFRELREQLEQIVKPEDSVRMYPLSRHTVRQIEIWGGIPLTERQGSIVV